MEIKLYFPFKTRSYQAHKIGTNRAGKRIIYKTETLVYYERDVLSVLVANRQVLKTFFEGYVPSTHFIKTTWLFPYKGFYIKKTGEVSSATLDIDNSVKNTQDLLFKYIGLNDKDICDQRTLKGPGTDGIYLSLKFVKKEELINIFENISIDNFTDRIN